jgi:hypothetical protein
MEYVNVTLLIIVHLCMISGCKVGENCILLFYYATSIGNSLLTF